MGKKRDSIKTDQLVEIFRADIKTTVHAAAKKTHCTASHASNVKVWVKGGCKETIAEYHSSCARRARKYQTETMVVTCLGALKPPHSFQTEFTTVGDRKIPVLRLCPRCSHYNEGMYE